MMILDSGLLFGPPCSQSYSLIRRHVAVFYHCTTQIRIFARWRDLL